MCRNIRTLFNFDPPATEQEIRDASLQFVRKLSGFNAPSKANAEAFDRAIREIAASARTLIDSRWSTTAEPRDREVEARESAHSFGREVRGEAVSCSFVAARCLLDVLSSAPKLCSPMLWALAP